MDAWGYALVALIGLVLPLLALETSRRLGDGPLPLPRRFFYAQTIVFQSVVLLVAVLAARSNGIDVMRAPARPLEGAASAAALLGIALAVLVIRWPGRTPAARRRLAELLPHDRREMPLYLALCTVAAIAEEVTYRAAAFVLLERLTGSWTAAAVLAAVAFALGHAIQGWRSVCAIFLFALGFHAIVLVAGSIWFAIAVHFAYDAIAGILIPRWERPNEPPGA